MAARDNEYWLDELVNAHRRGDDPRSIPTIWQTDAGLSSEELQRSAERYLQSDQYVDAILLPRGEPQVVQISTDRDLSKLDGATKP